jgi:hypothetical protein
MPLLTPHWDAPPKKKRYKSTTEEIKSRKQLQNLKAYKRRMAKIVYDPNTMTDLERSSLKRSKLAWTNRNRDIVLGRAWSKIITNRIVKCIEAMNKEVDVIVIPHVHPLPFNQEYNQEYFDVFVRYHRTTFDGRPLPEIGQV